MLKEIKYNGYSASPSDYLSPDGDLAYALNVIPERGSLQPLHASQVIASNLPGDILAVHRVGTEEHYIMYVDNNLVWAPTGNIKTTTHLQTMDTGVQSVTPIGNTLAVLDSEGTVHYFLWQNDAYKSLGSRLPELNIEPCLETRVDNLGDLKTTHPNLSDIETSVKLSDWLSYADVIGLKTDSADEYAIGDKSKREAIYNKVFSIINPIQNTLRKEGRFLAPFFVRFAFRLYDGSYAMHTVPFLMVPTSAGIPFLGISALADSQEVYFTPLISSSKLYIKGRIGDLSAWKNLITHIDVFVTQPLISYTDSAESIQSVTRAPYAVPRYNEDTSTYDWQTDYQSDTIVYNRSSLYPRQVLSLRKLYDDTHNTSTKYVSYDSFIIEPGKKFQPRRFNNDGNLNYDDYLVVDLAAGEVGDLFYRPAYVWKKVSPVADIPEGLPLPESNKYKVYKVDYSEYKFKDVTGIVTGNICKLNAETSNLNDAYLQLKLQRVDNRDYTEILTEYNTFYKCAEIDINELSSNSDISIDAPIKPDVLNNITSQATLKGSGALKQSKVSFVFSYNNRLNICVQEEQPASAAGINKQNPILEDANTSVGDIVNIRIVKALVKIEENGQVIYKDISDDWKTFIYPLYFCYPSLNATELVYTKEYNKIADNGITSPKVYSVNESITLTRHPFLNLAYAFNDFLPLQGQPIDELPQGYQTGILYGNKIKTSNVNNPFIFIEENTSELPVGEIFALSTAAKALSQGQFGQFPLYAFTDEGIWALEVTGTGTYSARQVLKRDICTNHKSITQIDDAVLFTSDRGIMLLAGSETTCISEILDGEVFDIGQLKHLGGQIQMDSWGNYRQNIQMLYCYPTQKIIVFNSDKEYFYVYSLESKQWAIQEGRIKMTVNNFPQAYAISGETLVDYAVEGNALPGAFVTRPLKLDAPDVHKTITAIIQRGQFKTGNVNTLLYGSRDLQTWYPVWGSKDHYLRGMRGTPYKYFRIASAVNLADGESLYGASVQYETKLDNKLR